MPIPSLNALLPEVSGRMLRTVAQSVNTRNFLVALGIIAGCVINGDTLTGILKQSTWLVVVVTVLTVVRTVEALVQRRVGGSAEAADISG